MSARNYDPRDMTTVVTTKRKRRDGRRRSGPDQRATDRVVVVSGARDDHARIADEGMDPQR
jgi:hypothetical protein